LAFCSASAAFAGPEELTEGRYIATRYGNQLWSGFSQTRFPVLVLTKSQSLLSCASSLPKGFTKGKPDPKTGCRTDIGPAGLFSVHMKATFPFGGAEPIVIVGDTGLSEKNSAAWIATLLHEHFHQYQMSWSGYYDELNALDLKNGDETGMWALKYPFSYEDPAIGHGLALLALQLASILQEKDPDEAMAKAYAYARLRPLVLGALSEADRRYLEFQLWQEGVARYTELAMTEFAAGGTDTRLNQTHDYAALAANLRMQMLRNLHDSSLSRDRRVYFYAFGAAEALVLDDLAPDWRQHYFEHPFSMAEFFLAAWK